MQGTIMADDHFPVPPERIERSILHFRTDKVMLSPHLAKVYAIPPRELRGPEAKSETLPAYSMLQLSRKEYAKRNQGI